MYYYNKNLNMLKKSHILLITVWTFVLLTITGIVSIFKWTHKFKPSVKMSSEMKLKMSQILETITEELSVVQSFADKININIQNTDITAGMDTSITKICEKYMRTFGVTNTTKIPELKQNLMTSLKNLTTKKFRKWIKTPQKEEFKLSNQQFVINILIPKLKTLQKQCSGENPVFLIGLSRLKLPILQTEIAWPVLCRIINQKQLDFDIAYVEQLKLTYPDNWSLIWKWASKQTIGQKIINYNQNYNYIYDAASWTEDADELHNKLSDFINFWNTNIIQLQNSWNQIKLQSNPSKLEFDPVLPFNTENSKQLLSIVLSIWARVQNPDKKYQLDAKSDLVNLLDGILYVELKEITRNDFVIARTWLKYIKPN